MAEDVVYGVNAVSEVLRAGPARVNRIFVARESRAHGIQTLLDAARESRVRFDYVPQAKINELTGSKTHQGVAATVSPVGYFTLEEGLADLPATATILVLDNVQHPSNVGLLIRSALGADAGALIMANRGGAPVSNAVVQASAGAVFHLPIIRVTNVGQALRDLKEAGFWVYGLTGESGEDLFACEWPERAALVLGNETTGLRPGVRKACDACLRIPLAAGLESLNAAVAGSIALFQVAQNRRRKE